MSALLKNLRVHFEDNVLSETVEKKRLDDELVSKKDNVAPILNYSREKLLEFGQSKASKESPKMFDFSGADDKRMEKIRHVLKNCEWSKSLSKYRIVYVRFVLNYICRKVNILFPFGMQSKKHSQF